MYVIILLFPSEKKMRAYEKLPVDEKEKIRAILYIIDKFPFRGRLIMS